MRILVVEDEKKLAASLKRGLEADGFAVDITLRGDDGLWMAREHDYDGMVLDIMLPGMNGYKVCETLRDDGNWTPILMLTAKDGELDEAEALDTGADDFLRKPFSHLVLVARLRALLRRGVRERPVELTADDLLVDPNQRRCWRDGTEIELTSREFSVLEYLIRNAGTVSCPSRTSSTMSGTTTSRAPRTSSRSTCDTFAGRSTNRSAGPRSRPCAAPATG